ncbi:adenylate/guanylate cyclase domain-containing protein [Mesorhizobium sp. VK23B]|uniref:Adenylate/guanylate cyclase domain-containing protein n=1 Tax=Mesorhizobium dulcispinae TaxID=3072316 RepID=A0ABU4XF71_9HYPH|nr:MULTISPECIES: adenylate/guanylate cyclase domain-containing protein [unclassified Mesorhizobium]MDX8466809.1 adenylate/guanylate cyclase domain-containing protein [Mesorhizobium sp. VK23B]MDX8473432.1 adenylate/guanylate cyclase domain-containing protein [Mesorhizobium sp. VK23A]
MREEQRRLAAILAADVAGYSRLMAADELGTLGRLKRFRAEVFEPKIARFHGRIVGSAGDSLLIEFGSAVNAVQCAIELQRELGGENAGLPENRRMAFRMGVNLGDVIVEDDTIYGDGVNIAARLEKLAEPGGVCIGRAIYDQVKGKLEYVYTDIGEQRVHNIAEPVRAYRVMSIEQSQTSSSVPSAKDALPFRNRPSIAVLPFTNMSGDPEQEYFSDGITEDIITDLSKVGALAVTARNTTFALKGKSMDVTEAARQLRVSHVLEGSVRKAGSRVRITAQLIDGTSGHHVWAERYDRDLNDIFALQDEIARAIVDALKIRLMPAEYAAIGKRTTENVEAYQYYLMGRQHFLRLGRRNHLSARRLYQRALEIDPQYALARAGLALAEGMLLRSGDPSANLVTLSAEAQRALALDSTLAEAHVAHAMAHFQKEQIELAGAACRRAIALDPDLYEAHRTLGDVLRMERKFAEAAAAYEKAAEVDRNSYGAMCMLWDCRKTLGDEEEAHRLSGELLTRIEKAMQLYPDDGAAYAYGCYILHNLGLDERALQWAERAITIDPEDYNSHYNVACFLAAIGAVEKAIDTLEHCVPQLGLQQVHWMAQDVDMNPLRDNPRYRALIERLEVSLAKAEGQSGSGTEGRPSGA